MVDMVSCDTLAMTPDSATAATATALEMVWWGWGIDARHEPLSASAQAMLGKMLDLDDRPRTVPKMPTPAPIRLQTDDIAVLASIVGTGNIASDDISRVAHCRGKSTTDLLRIRGGDVADAPDAVVLPTSHDEILAVLKACAARGIAVVPFGGGTSVVGGLVAEPTAFAGVIALDLRRLDELVAVDDVSMTATFQPGVRGPRAEALLAEHGLTLGHFPQSFEHASLGGFAATRSSGQASGGYGRFDEMVVGLTIATPTGSWRLGRGPANAAGPDLRQLVLGSEGAFGVITELVVAVHRAPAVRRYNGWQVVSFGAGLDVLRTLAQRDMLPTIARLSDEIETAAGLANATETGTQTSAGCYLVVGFEGDADEVAARERAVSADLSTAGARPLGGEFGSRWQQGRFHAPYLRDALLDIGGLVETVETTTSWSNIPALYRAVRKATVDSLGGAGAAVIVLCHVSHVYRTGASLYFTVICKQNDDPVDQWNTAKVAITDAIVAAGGSVTHHHGVGTVHRRWLTEEIGGVGVRVLAAVKHELDPTGILNPGVLVPRGDE